MVSKDSNKKAAKSVSDDIKDVAKELAMLDADPTADIKEISKKVKDTAKSTAKKATATAKKAGGTAKTTAKKATQAAKSTAKKAVSQVASKKDVSRTAVVEFAGNQYEVTDVITRCEEKYKSENKKKTYKDIKVYIKPENNAAYYVVDDISAGMINLI